MLSAIITRTGLRGGGTPRSLPLLCLQGYFNLSREKLQGRFRGKSAKTDFPAFLLTSLRLVVIPAIFTFRVGFAHFLRAYP